jgi:glyoxylate/hydroxypyruvate reductase
MQIFVYTDASEEDKLYLRNQLSNHDLFFKNENEESSCQEYFQHAEIVLGNVPVAWFTNHPPIHLKWWQLESAGFDRYVGLPLECPVTNVGDIYAQTCAETIIAGLLGLYRFIPRLAVLQVEKKWEGDIMRESHDRLANFKTLYQNNVIILGAGHIAQCTAKILYGFDCTVSYYARTSSLATIQSREDLLSALPNADVVISTLPGTAGVVVDAVFLSAMSKHSVFCNIGRGSVVDENALIHALQSGVIDGAVLDVFAKEPLPVDHPFWSMANVVNTQHTGGGQPNENRAKFNVFLDNLKSYIASKPLKNIITL